MPVAPSVAMISAICSKGSPTKCLVKTLRSKAVAGAAALAIGCSESPASAAPVVCRKARRVCMVRSLDLFLGDLLGRDGAQRVVIRLR